MFKAQIKFQKILSYILIATFVLVFILSLCLMTGVYQSLYQAYEPSEEVKEHELVKGSGLFYEMQPFNNLLLILAIVVLIGVIAYFVTGSKGRRRYYIGNYISAGLICVINVAVAITIIVGVSKYAAAFAAIDVAELEAFCKENFYKYTAPNLFWFYFGYVVSAILVVVAGLTVYNVIWKSKLMKKEDQLLSVLEVK